MDRQFVRSKVSNKQTDDSFSINVFVGRDAWKVSEWMRRQKETNNNDPKIVEGKTHDRHNNIKYSEN